MLSPHIAQKIQAKVAGLVNQGLSVVDPQGIILSSSVDHPPRGMDLSKVAWSISFSYGGKPVGYVVMEQRLPNHQEITPLIRSIAELIMHQSILLEQIPRQEERMDKFIYDILNRPMGEEPLISAEARLFELDLNRPRIAIVINIDDPVLTTSFRDPSNDREIRIERYKRGIQRALESFYTSSRDNIVAYIGHNAFCILKDLGTDEDTVEENVENFKKYINTIYDIIRSELKLPATVGVGNYHPGLEGLRQSYQEALSAIELGAQMWDQDRIYHIDDFGVVAPLLSGVDESNIYFSRELLEKLGENSEIIQTLEAFFNFNMSLTQTSKHLNIHRNTLVYRLDRINDTLGLDPRNFDDAVQIKLAILFNKFVENSHAN
jgi:carbohydrate diacid regulator